MESKEGPPLQDQGLMRWINCPSKRLSIYCRHCCIQNGSLRGPFILYMKHRLEVVKYVEAVIGPNKWAEPVLPAPQHSALSTHHTTPPAERASCFLFSSSKLLFSKFPPAETRQAGDKKNEYRQCFACTHVFCLRRMSGSCEGKPVCWPY